jgi:hypothetical protein
MALVQEDLRSKILSCTTDALGVVVAVDVLLGKPKISDLDVPVVAHQHVFWLQISVQNVLGVQMVQSQEYVRSVKSGSVFFESPNLRQVEEELTSWAVLKNEKQFAVALESVVHLNNERMPDIFLK